MVDGLVTFANGFKGQIWLEVFVLAGMTDDPDEIRRIAAIAARIHPARLQLNTVSRPPAERCALPVPRESLQRLCSLFSGSCEVIAEGPRPRGGQSVRARETGGEIVALVSRRPCTIEGIAAGLGLRPNEVVKHLDALEERGLVRSERVAGVVFYEGVQIYEAPGRPGGGSR